MRVLVIFLLNVLAIACFFAVVAATLVLFS